MYNDEGAADEEQRNSENLSEEKTEIVKENLEVSVLILLIIGVLGFKLDG